MHLNPAQYVVKVFGGVRKTAREIGRSPSSVSKWNKPVAAKGLGGEIPRLSQRAVLHVAKIKKLDITAEDIIFGRDVKN
jgi:hypothetical protein